MELGIAIAALIIGALALLFSLTSLVMIMARDKATHTVQMMPMDEEIDRANEEYLTKQKWATSDEAIKKQQKMYNEEVEESMPEFSMDDDDKEVFSL